MSRCAAWVVLWSVWAARLLPQPSPPLQLQQGALRGRLAPDGSHFQYFGIPYATSSAQYRFKEPGPAPRWEGVFEAVDEHKRCPQVWGPLVVGQEDCLVVNVYSPAGPTAASPRPVMVFIHGGGFKEGSGSRLLYGPEYIVARDVVLVTFNYRLNVMGFLCLGTKEAPGNAGLKDQVAALQWVQRNIREFGGDPDNVTIFGESAGGASVSYHLLSPMSRGLFHRAIAQSGSSLASWASQHDPRQVALALAKALDLPHNNVHQLYNKFMNEDFTNLVSATTPRKEGQLKHSHLPYTPCIEQPTDGEQAFITDLPMNILKSGNYTKVPVIIGANDREGYFFARFEDDESLASMRFEKYFPADLHFLSASERRTAAEQLKQLYIGDDEVSWKNIVKLSDMFGDTFFNYPTMIETELVLQSSDQPVYSYLFEYDGRRNFAKLTSGLNFWFAEGASHADDLFYLFHMFPVPSLFENEMIDTMTTLWTNFAKFGSPGGGAVQWRAARRDAPETLRVGARLQLAPLAAPLAPRMRFWRDLYDKHRARTHRPVQTRQS